VSPPQPDRLPDIDELTTVIEDFNAIFIRLPSVRRFSFSTLSVLHTLSRKGPLRLTELTGTEQLSQPAITSLVAKLARDGLVDRRPDPRDGRAILLSLTSQGREIVRSRHAERITRLSRLVARLNDEEREALAGSVRALARMIEIATTDTDLET
jgi:DNA-binding MarR family transcriptional regulator